MAAGVRNYGGGQTVSKTVSQLRESYFAPGIVLDRMDRAHAQVSRKFGAFVRQRAKTSMRYTLKSAAPGTPAAAHKSQMRTKTNRKTGVSKPQLVSPEREGIFFYYDPQTRTVIIGPTLWVHSRKTGNPTSGTIPETLEFGGSITILEVLREARNSKKFGHLPQRWKQARERISGRPSRMRTINVSAHPTMNLAFMAELPQLIGYYRNSM